MCNMSCFLIVTLQSAFLILYGLFIWKHTFCIGASLDQLPCANVLSSPPAFEFPTGIWLATVITGCWARLVFGVI